MKTTILTFVLVLAVSLGFAQQKDEKKSDAKAAPAAAAPAQAANVPEAIKKKFASTYTGVKNEVWTETKDGYCASFEQNGAKVKVMYDGAGNLSETHKEIKIKDAEKAGDKIQDYVKKNMGKSTKITKVVKITDAKGNVTYECTIKDKVNTFDAKGKYLGENAE